MSRPRRLHRSSLTERRAPALRSGGLAFTSLITSLMSFRSAGGGKQPGWCLCSLMWKDNKENVDFPGTFILSTAVFTFGVLAQLFKQAAVMRYYVPWSLHTVAAQWRQMALVEELIWPFPLSVFPQLPRLETGTPNPGRILSHVAGTTSICSHKFSHAQTFQASRQKKTSADFNNAADLFAKIFQTRWSQEAVPTPTSRD